MSDRLWVFKIGFSASPASADHFSGVYFLLSTESTAIVLILRSASMFAEHFKQELLLLFLHQACCGLAAGKQTDVLRS